MRQKVHPLLSTRYRVASTQAMAEKKLSAPLLHAVGSSLADWGGVSVQPPLLPDYSQSYTLCGVLECSLYLPASEERSRKQETAVSSHMKCSRMASRTQSRYEEQYEGYEDTRYQVRVRYIGLISRQQMYSYRQQIRACSTRRVVSHHDPTKSTAFNSYSWTNTQL